MTMTTKRLISILTALCAVLVVGCQDDANSGDPPTGEDAPDMKQAAEDMRRPTDMRSPADMRAAADMKEAVDLAPEPDMRADNTRPRVDADLSEHTRPSAPVIIPAAAYQAAAPDDLLTGQVATGVIGDYILENQHGKYVIEASPRAMSPCPWGGSIVDVAARDGDGFLEDNFMEICFTGNATQTFEPEYFEILNPGSSTDVAVIAATGKLALLDFLNLSVLTRDYLPETIQLAIDIDEVSDASVTVYYILGPEDRGLTVLTAVRNEQPEQLDMVLSNFISGGGDGGYFNPMNSRGGFGYDNLSVDSLEGVPVPYVIWRGRGSSYAYVPEVDESLGHDLPTGGVSLATSGATVTVLRRKSVLQTVLAPPQTFKRMSGLFHIAPGESDSYTYKVYPGTGALNSMLDHIYPTQGLTTTTLTGTITSGDGAVAVGARVSAIDEKGRALNQAITGEDGSYSMALPTERTYTIQARHQGVSSQPSAPLTAVDGEPLTADLALAAPATVDVVVTRSDGTPTPARITLWCVGACANKGTAALEDVSTDALPSNIAAIVPTNTQGVAKFKVAAGTYRVTVSRGIEWSIWPEDTRTSGGFLVELGEGEELTLQPEIEHVVRTPGALTGDFHIHAVNSTDSAVRHSDRVLGYMTDGVDVMVSTDHDYIADYAPAIRALGATSEITSVIGAEITTSDTGHYNAFPLAIDESHPRGGALDWANAAGPSLLPQDIFDWVNEFEGEQVIQVNHPLGDSHYGALRVDTLRGMSLATPAEKNLVEVEPDPETGDTNVWSEGFTAMEIMNGNSLGRFWHGARHWMTMVGRGFSPTMTAVTDTHRQYSDIGHVPRSVVFVGEAYDSPESFDQEVFASAINAGKLIGTNGPFFTIELENASGETASLGETLDATQDQRVTGTVKIELPEWMEVDTLDLYTNREDVVLEVDEEDSSEIVPDQRIDIELDPSSDLVVVGQGASTHRRWEKTVTFELDVSADAYLIAVVRGRKASTPNLQPLATGGTKPFAYANPIFIDADGGGYDKPVLAGLAATAPPPPSAPSYLLAPSTRHTHGAPSAPTVQIETPPTTLTREQFWGLIQQTRCDH